MHAGLKFMLSGLLLPLSCLAGQCLAVPVVGAPHAFPGLLMEAPEPVRTAVALAIMTGTWLFALWLVWRKPRGQAAKPLPPEAPDEP